MSLEKYKITTVEYEQHLQYAQENHAQQMMCNQHVRRNYIRNRSHSKYVSDTMAVFDGLEE